MFEFSEYGDIAALCNIKSSHMLITTNGYLKMWEIYRGLNRQLSWQLYKQLLNRQFSRLLYQQLSNWHFCNSHINNCQINSFHDSCISNCRIDSFPNSCINNCRILQFLSQYYKGAAQNILVVQLCLDAEWKCR